MKVPVILWEMPQNIFKPNANPLPYSAIVFAGGKAERVLMSVRLTAPSVQMTLPLPDIFNPAFLHSALMNKVNQTPAVPISGPQACELKAMMPVRVEGFGAVRCWCRWTYAAVSVSITDSGNKNQNYIIQKHNKMYKTGLCSLHFKGFALSIFFLIFWKL